MTQEQLERDLGNQSIKLGDMLVQKKLIAGTQLHEVLFKQSETPKRLGQLLIEAGYISKGQLKSALREQYWRQNGYWLID